MSNLQTAPQLITEHAEQRERERMTIDEWQPPTGLDVAKELNAQAGRLGTLLGLLLTAAALSFSSGFLRDEFTSQDGSFVARWIGTNATAIAGLLGSNLTFATVMVFLAMQPATQSQHQPPNRDPMRLRVMLSPLRALEITRCTVDCKRLANIV